MARIRLHWSPEPISGRLRREDRLSMAPEWVYHFVYADQATCGDLCVHLRCQRKQRKRYVSGRGRRGGTVDGAGIAKQPAGVHVRSRIGHWKGERSIGKGHSGAAAVLVECKSRFRRIRKLLGKSAKATQRTIQRRLGPIAERMQIPILDNGKEFSRHQAVARVLEVAVFFADPHLSWQRGANENTNGFIR